MKPFSILFILSIIVSGYVSETSAHKTSARFQTSPTLKPLPKSLPTEFIVSDVTELNAALAKVQAGDVIVWKDGKYKDIKINFNPKTNGTADKPIILKAQTAGKVTFSGSSKIAIGGEYLQVEGFLFEGNCTLETKENVIDFKVKAVEAHHCRVTNCAIKNYSMTEASEKENYFVNMVGTYNEVDNCHFSDKTNKGPTLIVEYKQGKDYVAGSDVAPSTHHKIHHNYFGYRTFPSNGGEQIRVGTSTTSFSHGFNIIEYNYFEDERLEAEIISNKSFDNIYRFNTFIGNDGAVVIRHGQRCFVYGNYINGRTGRNQSGGLRIINPNNTVFNNYVEELEGGNSPMKAPITVMSGLEGSALNEYYPADNAIVAYNTLVGCVGPATRIGVGNASKGKPFVAPKNVWIVGNLIVNTTGKNTDPIVIADAATTCQFKDNQHTDKGNYQKGFATIKEKALTTKDGFKYRPLSIDAVLMDSINQRLAIHNIKLTEKDITTFDPKWKLTKKDVGVSWMK
jgi:poly(beta-D-mannuronate) lyase